MGSHFFHHSTGAYLVDRDFANCSAIRRSQFAHEMHAKRNSHLVHILEMVELVRDTKASAHSPWGVYATAWVLRWATNTLLTPYRSRARRSPHQFGRSWVVRGCRTVVCTSSLHLQQLGPPWGTAPICTHTPGITGHCLIILGDHAHHHRMTVVTHSAADTIFDGSNCGMAVWW